MTKTLSIHGLRKSYGNGEPVVADVSFHAEAGEFVTVVGPSGCGKTTILRLVAGFLAPDAGTINVGGRQLSAPDDVVPPERRGMGMVFQSYALWPHMSVSANVGYGLRRSVPKADVPGLVEQALRMVDLHDYGDRMPAALSGGQQQRVALARALAYRPALILLDEPLSNLDTQLRARTREQLFDLQQNTGITFLYVTHDQHEALAMADRVVILNHGRLEQIGTPRQIYDAPDSLFVAEFLGALDRLSIAETTAIEDDDVMVTVPGGTKILLPASNRRDGDDVLGIRPHAVRLATNGDGESRYETTLEAKVVRQTYLGSAKRLEVEVPGGRLHVDAPPEVDTRDYVQLTLDGRACLLLAEE